MRSVALVALALALIETLYSHSKLLICFSSRFLLV